MRGIPLIKGDVRGIKSHRPLLWSVTIFEIVHLAFIREAMMLIPIIPYQSLRDGNIIIPPPRWRGKGGGVRSRRAFAELERSAMPLHRGYLTLAPILPRRIPLTRRGKGG